MNGDPISNYDDHAMRRELRELDPFDRDGFASWRRLWRKLSLKAEALRSRATSRRLFTVAGGWLHISAQASKSSSAMMANRFNLILRPPSHRKARVLRARTTTGY